MKTVIRARVLAERRNQTKTIKGKKDAAILRRISRMSLFKRAHVLFCYVSMKDEVNTLLIIQKNLHHKKIIVPKSGKTNRMTLFALGDHAHLKKGRYGILEPHYKLSKKYAKKQVDLAIVPGIAFDRFGHRIGFGKGYFDRFLKTITAPKVALAYEFQLVDKIPATPYDVPVDFIVTEKRIIKLDHANPAA